MRLLLYTLFGTGVMLLNIVHARPVSYPDGWTAMLRHDGTRSTAHIHYSPTAKKSFGYKFERWRSAPFTLHALQVNNLLTRRNQPDSQANVYLKYGIGVAHGYSGALTNMTGAAAFAGVAADWENRRYFAAYENRYTEVDKMVGFFQQSVRVGWAPYEGDYGDLHTWLMLQVDHRPEANNSLTLTPLIRLFKGVHLVEAGVNTHGKTLVNYVSRF